MPLLSKFLHPSGAWRTLNKAHSDKEDKVIKQGTSGLGLSAEAKIYYDKQLKELLNGKSESQWASLISAQNQGLQFDDKGNILTFDIVGSSHSAAYVIVRKNGEVDSDLSKTATSEFLTQRDQTNEANFENFLVISQAQ